MDKDILQSNFIDRMKGVCPEQPVLVKKIMEILNIEKEAVYRRLRGTASFSFGEIALLSQAFGISLDNLIGVDTKRAFPFSLIINDFETPTQQDLDMCESYISLLKVIADDPTACCTETWNSLPFPMTYEYDFLTRFYLLKWNYQFKMHIPARKLKEISILPELLGLHMRSLKEFKRIAKTNYILSSTLFKNVAEDILYFYHLGLIDKDEIIHLKKELYAYLNYFESLANSGKFEETGTSFSLYVSHIQVDLNQCYIESDVYNFCMFRVLVFNSISSIDGTKNDNFKSWLTGKKRLSTLISVSGEKDRLKFFRIQREAIDKLLSF